VRIVFAPHAYAPSIGGAERYAQGLAEGLVGLGHDVHVVVADIDDPEAFYELGHRPVGRAEETISGVEVHRIPFVTRRYRWMGRLGSREAISSCIDRFSDGLARTLDRLAPRAVVTLPHLFPNVEKIFEIAARSRWKLIYAPLLHEDDPYWSVEAVARRVAAADGVVALTDHERERLTDSYGASPERTAVIPPGVEVSKRRVRTTREPVVLFLGRRTASKRLDFLYEAMREVWKNVPAARLVVAGPPASIGLDPAASMAADGRVTVVDSPSETEKDLLLATARLVVSPSLTESFGLTTLEAWAAGTPVVVVDSPVNRSVVRDGVDGLIASGPSSHDLSSAIRRLLMDIELASRLGEAGQRRVNLEYSWSIVAPLLGALVEKVVPTARD
jgi:glycosyltransferase involved in cell wall biosynthesis